ncbi:MAG TPA: acetyl-coenzyme A synthetase N-terminal domain-containing protein [Nitrososphaeraceae archaeon]|nr:acetyl-coenzyme A synthetase N-terminal domain-containing protein [Nitrososphaeraceae archaeon]
MTANKNNFIYTPNEEERINSNISRFMIKHGITDYSYLLKKSNENIKWYWNTINDDLNLEWYKKYDRVYDSSNGIPWTRWFINGKCNIIANVIDKHAKNQPDKIAYIFENEIGMHIVLSHSSWHNVICVIGYKGYKKLQMFPQ